MDKPNKTGSMAATLVALAASSGFVGSHAEIFERAQANGVYHGVWQGFKAEHEREYQAEFPRLLEARHKVDRLLRRLNPQSGAEYLLSLAEYRAAEDYLSEFERYMRSLTEVKHEETTHNTVVTVGKNLALDTYLAGSSYTVTGPYMGLIGAVSYSTIVAADTMASHGGWTEGGGTNAPTYTGPRKTISWSAASAGSKAASAIGAFAMTGTGTVKGVFLVFGSGAVSTLDSTAGVLYSAGLFTGGDQAVVSTNTLTVTYSTSL